MEFRKIKLEDKSLIDEYLRKYPCYGSTYSMAYLACWDYFDFANMEICEYENSLIFRFRNDGHNKYLAELTSMENFPSLVEEILDNDKDAYIVQLEASYAYLVDESKYIINHNIDYDEYLYLPDDLINLKGKKYHGKRNHIKKFLSLYPDFVFRNYEKSDRENVLRLFSNWEEEKGIEIDSERAVIINMLDHFDEFDLLSSVVEVDGKIIGFTMGELLASNVGVVHIEKGDTNYEGIYPIINMLFVKQNFADTIYVNRQEDVGIEGLRRAKRSYYPVKMSEKCSITRRNN